MNRTLTAVFLAALIAVIGYVMYKSDRADSDTPTTEATASPVPSPTASPEASATASPTTSPSASSTAPLTAAVVMQNTAYSPAKVTVKKGGSVTWTNNDSVAHDVVGDSGPESFRSQLLSRGQAFSFTFTKAGTYTYHCTPHSFMTGTVEVVE
ncbi:MAG TPA: plastocyanin/azurin family copper-binding protein [Verrucomicrobiae bacterium]|nr:plastocyanin/azurin family copper-binding protein [Verrucomicrobiae bacterium]